MLLLLAGCVQPQQQSRFQAEDETDRDRYGVRTVFDVCAVGNAEPISVFGVGLVTGLEGTGGSPEHDNYRSMLEHDLNQRGVKKVREMLDSPANALVLVQGQIPPGSRKGDRIDLEVSLPPRSRATSLRGGYLQECLLMNYEFAGNLKQGFLGNANEAFKGHQLVKAEGNLLVGLGDGDEASRQRRGRIWGGGRTRLDLPLTLVLNQDHQQARVAQLVADRINESFRLSQHAGPDGGLARAHDNISISLQVPAQYRLNLPRYLRVVGLVPLREGDSVRSPDGAKRPPYRPIVARDLLDPARTVAAALRLEALGESSIPPLKAGIESKHPLVRFCSAEALAYLGSPSCANELARDVARQPYLRAFALTALASLDEAVAPAKLRELLETSSEDEVRYGAFRALRALDEKDPAVRGELLNDSFWVHRAGPGTEGLVHLTTSRRAEVVFFGEEPFLKAPFSFLAGEFTVTAAAEDTKCTLTRVPPRGGEPTRRQCSLKLDEVLRTLADLGGSYPEVVDLLRQADKCQCLSSRVRFDAFPQAVSVFDLAKVGREPQAGDELLIQSLPGGQDLGLTPTLYDTGREDRPARKGDGESMKDERGPREPEVAAGR